MTPLSHSSRRAPVGPGAALLDPFFWTAAMALLALRIVFNAQCDLVPDEAFYWTWTRHLSTGYFDHPPMIAWLIWLSTRVFGNTETGVRVPAAVMMIGTLAVLRLIARPILPDSRAVGFVLLMWIAGPLLTIMGSIHTPDASATFFSVCALACAARAIGDFEDAEAMAGSDVATGVAIGAGSALADARVPGKSDVVRRGAIPPAQAAPAKTTSVELKLKRTSAWAWLAFGLFCGLALLSKYTTVLVPVGVGLALLTSRPGWRQLARPWLYLAALLALAVFSPCIFWNAKHQWASFLFQLNHGAGDGLTHPGVGVARAILARLGGLAAFVGGQAVVWTPVLFGISIVVLIGNWIAVLRAMRGVSGRGPGAGSEVGQGGGSNGGESGSSEYLRTGVGAGATDVASAPSHPGAVTMPGLTWFERMGKLEHLSEVDWMLLWSATLPLIVFGWAATRSRGEINWPAFAYFPLSLLIGRYLSENWSGFRVQWVQIGCKVAIGFTIAVHVMAIPAVQQALGRHIRLTHQITDLWGWRDFGRQLGQLARSRETYGSANVRVVCNRHQDAGEAAFYMPGQPDVWCESKSGGSRTTAYDFFDHGRPDYAHLPQVFYVGDRVEAFMKNFGYAHTLVIMDLENRRIVRGRSHRVYLLAKELR